MLVQKATLVQKCDIPKIHVPGLYGAAWGA